MTENDDTLHALLDKLRQDFISEIPDRCNAFERQIFELEKSPGNAEIFNELYRGVHSLKGSGGTHGLNIVTTICHQLENLLTDARQRKAFGRDMVSLALAHVDLILKVADIQKMAQSDYREIEKSLDGLKKSVLKNRKSILIVESSRLMTELYREVLDRLPVQLVFMDNGLAALGRLMHEHFDLVIVGRELKELGGIALMAAVRESHVRHSKMPAILVSSNEGGVPAQVSFAANILRDQNLAQNLQAVVKKALGL